MATKPQQQDLKTRDDEKNDAQIISRDSDSTGSLDSAVLSEKLCQCTQNCCM